MRSPSTKVVRTVPETSGPSLLSKEVEFRVEFEAELCVKSGVTSRSVTLKMTGGAWLTPLTEENVPMISAESAAKRRIWVTEPPSKVAIFIEVPAVSLCRYSASELSGDGSRKDEAFAAL